MRQRLRATELSPMFRSLLQAEILALLFTSGAELTVNEIATAVGRDRSQTAREVSKLVNAGFLAARTAGRARIVRSNTDSPVYDAVAKIVLHTYGPRHVITAALQPIEGVVEAWIFGSWAARYHGEAGPPPGDIDVLVVGYPDPDDVWEAAVQAGRQQGREVNARVIRPEWWESREDPFLAEVRTRPLVRLEIVPRKDA